MLFDGLAADNLLARIRIDVDGLRQPVGCHRLGVAIVECRGVGFDHLANGRLVLGLIRLDGAGTKPAQAQHSQIMTIEKPFHEKSSSSVRGQNSLALFRTETESVTWVFPFSEFPPRPANH